MTIIDDLVLAGKAIPIAPGPFLHLCPACGGHELRMAYEVKGGPFSGPHGRGSKWLSTTKYKPGWYSGTLHREPCPVCAEGKIKEFVQNRCNLSEYDRALRLDSFDVEGELSGKASAKRALIDLIAMNKSPNGYVTFIGGYGVGKTTLLKILVNAFVNISVYARYERMSDVLAGIREQWGDQHGAQAVEESIQSYMDIPVMAIDEIDRVSMTPWAKETMFRLLDQRFEGRHRLLTVMATNTRVDQMVGDLGYLRSRVSGGLVVDVPGTDMRPVTGQIERKDFE